MRILLKVPPTWYVEPLRSGLTHYRMPEAPTVRMLVSALVPLPSDVAAWRVRELHALVPDECEVVIAAERKGFSNQGWPMRVIDPECRRRGDVGGAPLGSAERRAERRGAPVVGAPLGSAERGAERSGAPVVENWLAVFLQAGHNGAIALVRAPRGDLSPELRREILAILAGAQP